MSRFRPTLAVALGLLLSGAVVLAQAEPGTPRSEAVDQVVGTWQVTSELGLCRVSAVLTIENGEQGWTGRWESLGRSYPLGAIEVTADRVTFTRRVGEEDITFEGTWNADSIRGKVVGSFGVHPTSAVRARTESTRRRF